MSYLVDSDWVADWLAGTANATRLLSTLRPGWAGYQPRDLWRNLRRHLFRKRPEQIFYDFLRGVDVLPLTRRIMQRFARIRGDLRRKGQLISDPNILIAATAIHHDLILLPRNVKDFQRTLG